MDRKVVNMMLLIDTESTMIRLNIIDFSVIATNPFLCCALAWRLYHIICFLGSCLAFEG